MMPSLDELKRDFLVAGDPAPVMRLDELTAAAPLEPAVIAIGVFDGMHRGHRALLARTVAEARERGINAYAVTFDPDPDVVVSPHPARYLMSTSDRIRTIAATGVDGVIVLPFTRELAALDHARFFEQVLLPVCPVRSIHVGSDFRLGRGGASTVPVIRDWCAARGIAVHGHELVLDGGAPVTATRIRARLAAGDIAGARAELERRYLVRGTVASGRGEGTGMGFPTANVTVDVRCQMPKDGVYAGLALVNDMVWPAAINVGLPPTFRDAPHAASLEANLIAFSGELYGAPIALAFDSFIRPSRTFPSERELIATVLGNIADIRAAFGESGVSLSGD